MLADEITANVNDLGGKLADRYDFAQRSTTGVALLMVSDWGKIQAFATGSTTRGSCRRRSTTCSRLCVSRPNQWFRRNALVPVRVSASDLGHPEAGRRNPNGTSCEFSVGEGGTLIDHPWRDLPASMQVKITLGFIGTREVKTGLFATDGFRHSPSATIGNLLFNSPDARSPGLGLEPLRFFDPGLFDGRLLHADDASERCDLPFCEPRAVAAARPRQSRPWGTCRSSSRRCSSRPPG